MHTDAAFTPGERYDRDHASDGESRYGAYLRRTLAADGKPTSNPLEFAAAAWRTARPPVMSPGYVTAHPDVSATEASWDYDGRLSIRAEVITEVPRELARSLRGSWSGWGQYRPAAGAVLRFWIPIPADVLPEPVYTATAAPDTTAAKHAVDSVCTRLNAALSDVFAHLARKEVA
ncbi:hypothetical protein DFQ14_10398 [Halopolyspora algeriensis]|uniref:Uncharacterized protein n=1 Tax=Halopolyspora algeriensis TaxID=1500506 RepID=A0A368VZQ0_9ACTN|nr:hypothetical protein [Halopolyspora algeriensis]RCW45134.1 hypothetical protein DFQ14_10398 [Halopolyspora algeriensis]TQM53145.1 hypothetical protein FHU43_2526 [Halopolyspora algeriensis]